MKQLCVGLTALSVSLLLGCNGGGGSSSSSSPTSKTTPGSTASPNTGSTTKPGTTGTTPGSTAPGTTPGTGTSPGKTLPGTGSTGTLPGTGGSTGTITPPRTTPPSTGGTSTPPSTGGTSTPPRSGGTGTLPGGTLPGTPPSSTPPPVRTPPRTPPPVSTPPVSSPPVSSPPRGTPVSRGGSGVSTGSSTQGTLQITVSPSSGAVGDMIAIQMAQINPAAAGVAMALLDAQGNVVQCPNQTLSQTNPNEIDFAVPQTPAAGYSVVVELLDQTGQTVVDYAMAPFTVTSGGTRRGGGSAPGTSGTSTGSSTTGTLQISVTPGGGNVGDTVAITLTGLDPNAQGVGMQLVDPSGNPVQVPNQTINQQTSSSTSVEIDFVIPSTPAGAYVCDVAEFDASGNPLDDAQAPFTVGSGGTRRGSGGSGSGSSSGGSTASTTGTSVSGGQLSITVTPGGGNAGDTIAVTFANLDPNTAGIGMGLVDPSGNVVQVSQQQLNPANPNELDFVIPQTPTGGYQVVFGEFDSSQNIIDEALAPFTIGGGSISSGGVPPRSGGTPGTGSAGSTTGVSISGGQLSFTSTPGGGQVGDTIQLVFANIDPNTAGIGMALIDPNGNVVQVSQQQLDPQNPNALDFVIPQTPSGSYQVVFGEFDQSGNIIDEAVAPFTVQ